MHMKRNFFFHHHNLGQGVGALKRQGGLDKLWGAKARGANELCAMEISCVVYKNGG